MNTLTVWAYALGGVAIACGALLAVAPARVRAWLAAFPRGAWPARILATACAAWIAWLLVHTPLGMLENYRRVFYALVPITLGLVVVFMDELLAPRALGGILLLAPVPILDAARWHPSAWRYVMIVAAYLMVVKGVALVLSPFVFRKWSERALRSDGRCRAVGALELAFGVGVWLLGLLVY